MSRWLPSVLVLFAACSARSPYACSDAAQCVLAGAAGVCEPQGFCSFADSSCPGGRKFEPNAGDGLANSCVSVDAQLVDAPHVDAPPDVPLEPIAFVQATAASMTGVSQTVDFLQPLAAHHTVIACIDFASVAVANVTDSLGSHYTAIAGPITNGALRMYIFAAFDVTGGADTVTFTLSESVSGTEVYIHEYAGLVRVDAMAAESGTAATIDGMRSGAAETHAANELIFGFGITGSADAGTGFTARSNFHSNVTEDMIAAAPGSYEATATMTGGSNWTMMLATFVGE